MDITEAVASAAAQPVASTVEAAASMVVVDSMVVAADTVADTGRIQFRLIEKARPASAGGLFVSAIGTCNSQSRGSSAQLNAPIRH